MALFSDNPFAGVFRAQKRREAEAAMGQQQAMAEQEQQRQKSGMEQLKAEEEFRSENPGVRELQAMSKANSFYGYGGGTIGASGLFRMVPKAGSYGTTNSAGKYVPPEMVPQLKPQYQNVGTAGYGQDLSTATTGLANKKKVAILPVGAGGRQELRYLKESAEARGIPWTEAPEKFVRGKGTSERDRREQFYSEVTGQPMGTLLGRGAYGGFGKDAVDEQGNPISKYSPNVMKRRAKRGQNPYNAESGGYVEKQEPSSFFPQNAPIFPFPAISTPIGGMMRSFA